jgi:hypothetical protein
MPRNLLIEGFLLGWTLTDPLAQWPPRSRWHRLRLLSDVCLQALLWRSLRLGDAAHVLPVVLVSVRVTPGSAEQTPPDAGQGVWWTRQG